MVTNPTGVVVRVLALGRLSSLKVDVFAVNRVRIIVEIVALMALFNGGGCNDLDYYLQAKVVITTFFNITLESAKAEEESDQSELGLHRLRNC